MAEPPPTGLNNSPTRSARSDAEPIASTPTKPPSSYAAPKAGGDGWHAPNFHSYSLANQLLIAMARPTATRAAGFRAWLKLGYAIRRGERAIKIWAPCRPSRKQIERWQQQGADPDQRPRTYFKLVPVFAHDQVDPLPPHGEPEPLDPPIHDVTGDELADAIPKLDALAAEIGCTVHEEAMNGGCHGYYEIDTGRIAIDTGLSANGKVKTRVHELAHALIRRERQDDDPELDRASEELVVESIAFTSVGALGVNTDGYSVPYLASWAEQADLAVLEQTATLIDRLASRIEDAVLEAPAGQPEDGASEAL
jgi:antirestriction protein ArdC